MKRNENKNERRRKINGMFGTIDGTEFWNIFF